MSQKKGDPQAAVWLVCGWHNCADEDGRQDEGTLVLAVCATEQLAEQVKDKIGHGYVREQPIATTMRETGVVL